MKRSSSWRRDKPQACRSFIVVESERLGNDIKIDDRQHAPSSVSLPFVNWGWVSAWSKVLATRRIRPKYRPHVPKSGRVGYRAPGHDPARSSPCRGCRVQPWRHGCAGCSYPHKCRKARRFFSSGLVGGWAWRRERRGRSVGGKAWLARNNETGIPPASERLEGTGREGISEVRRTGSGRQRGETKV